MKAHQYRLSIFEPEHAPFFPPGNYESEDEAVDAAIGYLDSIGVDWVSVDMDKLVGE